MKQSATDIINKVLLVIAFLTALVLIIMLAWKLLGRSPETTTILGLFIALLTSLQIVMLGQLFNINKALGKMEEFKKHVEREIRNLKRKKTSKV